MGIIITAYQTVFFQPLFNGLVYLTGIVPLHDFGVAIIILTFLVRIIIFPFTHRSITTQIKMKEIEPHIKKIRQQFKNNQQEIAKKTMELYKAHGVSPFSGCLMLVVQFPILIALYHVFVRDISSNANLLYSFVSLPDPIHVLFLGLIDLTATSIVMAFLAGFSQFIQMHLAMPPKSAAASSSSGPDFQKMLMSHGKYIFPLIIIFISFRFPAALALYWTTSNIFAILHEGVVRRRAQKLSSDQKNAEHHDRSADTRPHQGNDQNHS